MATVHLTDRQWAFIQPLLPPPARTGRPRANDRQTVEGILYVLITGCRWQDLPREYGAPTTVWRRLRRWGEEGAWERIWRAALAALDRGGQLDWTLAFLDGSLIGRSRLPRTQERWRQSRTHQEQEGEGYQVDAGR